MLVSCKKPVVTEADNWEILFNGQDLTDWIVKINGYDLNDNYNNTFRVENGSLVVSYDHYDNFTTNMDIFFIKNHLRITD